MHFYLVGIVEAEIEQLFVAEVIELLVEALTNVIRHLVHAINHARFRVIVVFVFANFEFLSTRIGCELCNREWSAGSKRRSSFLRICLGAEFHFRVGQLAEQLIHLSAVGSQRLRPENLPLIFVAAEFNLLLVCGEFDAADFVGLEREQPLVAQIIHAFVQSGLVVSRKCKYSAIAFDSHVSTVIGRRIIANEQLVRLTVFLSDADLERGLAQTILVEVACLLFDQSIGIEGG